MYPGETYGFTLDFEFDATDEYTVVIVKFIYQRSCASSSCREQLLNKVYTPGHYSVHLKTTYTVPCDAEEGRIIWFSVLLGSATCQEETKIGWGVRLPDDLDPAFSVPTTIRAEVPTSFSNRTSDFSRVSSWRWTVNGVEVGSERNLEYAFPEEDRYTVGLEAQDFCTGQWYATSKSVDVSPRYMPPEGRIHWRPSSVMAQETVSFQILGLNDPDGGRRFDIEWEFGDGSIATGERPQHTYFSSGRYSVTALVCDDEGQCTEMEKFIRIAPNPVAEFRWDNIPAVVSWEAGYVPSFGRIPDGGAYVETSKADSRFGNVGWRVSSVHADIVDGSLAVLIRFADGDKPSEDRVADYVLGLGDDKRVHIRPGANTVLLYSSGKPNTIWKPSPQDILVNEDSIRIIIPPVVLEENFPPIESVTPVGLSFHIAYRGDGSTGFVHYAGSGTLSGSASTISSSIGSTLPPEAGPAPEILSHLNWESIPAVIAWNSDDSTVFGYVPDGGTYAETGYVDPRFDGVGWRIATLHADAVDNHLVVAIQFAAGDRPSLDRYADYAFHLGTSLRINIRPGSNTVLLWARGSGNVVWQPSPHYLQVDRDSIRLVIPPEVLTEDFSPIHQFSNVELTFNIAYRGEGGTGFVHYKGTGFLGQPYTSIGDHTEETQEALPSPSLTEQFEWVRLSEILSWDAAYIPAFCEVSHGGECVETSIADARFGDIGWRVASVSAAVADSNLAILIQFSEGDRPSDDRVADYVLALGDDKRVHIRPGANVILIHSSGKENAVWKTSSHDLIVDEDSIRLVIPSEVLEKNLPPIESILPVEIDFHIAHRGEGNTGFVFYGGTGMLNGDKESGDSANAGFSTQASPTFSDEAIDIADWLASLGNDLPQDDDSNYALVIPDESLGAAMGGMHWNSPDPTDLTCWVRREIPEDATGISVTVSASAAMEMELYASTNCDYPSDMSVRISSEPQTYVFPFSSWTGEIRGQCYDPKLPEQWNYLDRVVLFPSARSGELHVHAIS